jgi:transcriptional regulator with XRE-family HTH domain
MVPESGPPSLIKEMASPRVTSKVRELRAVLWARQGSDYSIRACAERAGISERTWAGYERGEAMPPLDIALKMAEVLGVDVAELGFRRVGQPDQEAERGRDHDIAEPGG